MARIVHHGRVLVQPHRMVEASSRHADLAQLVHLVLHQRHQRRYHDRQSIEQQRGELIAQRLAAAGWHHDERVLLP